MVNGKWERVNGKWERVNGMGEWQKGLMVLKRARSTGFAALLGTSYALPWNIAVCHFPSTICHPERAARRD
jgi:hypothetical protein